MDGDVVQVCPGVYREQLDVTKSISIVGPVGAVSGLDCFSDTPAQPADLDTTQVAVLEPLVPTREATDPVVTLDADNVELAGLVIQGVWDDHADTTTAPPYPLIIPAVSSTDAFSGYRIHHNLVRLNTFGVELGSSGDSLSRFDHNCLRENRWGWANQRRHLNYALVDANSSFRTGLPAAGFCCTGIAYEVGWGYRPTDRVTLQGNESSEDNLGYRVENTTATRVTGNLVTAPFSRGIAVVGGNAGLEIADNLIQGGTNFSVGPVGILFQALTAQVPARSTDVVVYDNTVAGISTAAGTVGTGIAMGNGTTSGAIFFDNVVSGSGQVGFSILNNNRDNVVRDNVSLDNGTYGIRIQGTGSTGNLFQDNRMEGNTLADARDDTDPNLADGIQLLSIWVDNNCNTDMPEDAICGVE